MRDLQAIHEKEAYYISRLKLNTRIYIKNPEPEYFKNGTMKKQTEYIQLDMAQMMTELEPAETPGNSGSLHWPKSEISDTCHHPSINR